MSEGEKTKAAAGRSFPVLSIAFLLMLGLKLADVGQAGELSWWWVTAPLWCVPVLAFALVGAVAGVWGVIFGAVLAIEYVDDRLRARRRAREVMGHHRG